MLWFRWINWLNTLNTWLWFDDKINTTFPSRHTSYSLLANQQQLTVILLMQPPTLCISVGRWKTISFCGFKISYFTKHYGTYGKKENRPKNYTIAKLCPVHHVTVTARRLCPLNEMATVCFTQYGQLHPVKRSLLPLLPSNTKAPYLHTVSVFYPNKLNSLREMTKLSYSTFVLLMALLIVYCTEGKIIVQIR